MHDPTTKPPDNLPPARCISTENNDHSRQKGNINQNQNSNKLTWNELDSIASGQN
jgi:hypothetical protein